MQEKIIKDAIKELKNEEKKIEEDKSNHLEGKLFKSLFYRYLDNNMLLSKCFFCGDKLVGDHKCRALYPPEIKKTKSKESKKEALDEDEDLSKKMEDMKIE